MKKAWRILKKKYKDYDLAAFGCGSYVFNLLMEDIGNLETTKIVVKQAKQIVRETRKSIILSATFKLIQQNSPDKITTTLKNPGNTCFGSTVTCLQSLLVNKSSLQH